MNNINKSSMDNENHLAMHIFAPIEISHEVSAGYILHIHVCVCVYWNTHTSVTKAARTSMYSCEYILVRAFPGRDSKMACSSLTDRYTVETLYSTIYYSKYFIELNFDKSTQYVALWTHKRHPVPRPFGQAMGCLLWVLQQKLTVL